MRKQEPHRGPGKAGKKQVSVHLSEDELSALRAMAERNCRSVSHQILWIIRQAIAMIKVGPDQDQPLKLEDSVLLRVKARQAIATIKTSPDQDQPLKLEDSVFFRVKASLEDYQSQTRCRITKKLIADSVKEHGLPPQEAASVRGRLEAIFC